MLGPSSPGLRGPHSHDLQVCSVPWSYSPFALTASVSTETRPHGLGEGPLRRCPCTAPPLWESPVQAWKYLRPSLADLQTKQASWCSGQSSSTAARLPVLLAVRKPVPATDILRKPLGHGSFRTCWPKRKAGQLKAGIQHSQAVALRRLLMQTHQEPLGATRRRLSRTSSSAGPSFA